MQVQDPRHAFASTAKNDEKCSTATPGLAAGTGLPSPLWPGLQALLLSCAAMVILLEPGASLAATEKACRFADDAPEQHLVVRGDTLWDLASRFLRDPWCWPWVWDDNRDLVANPHLIYPGQLIRLDRARGLLNSTAAPAESLPVVRLAPALRAEVIDNAPVPLIAPAWLALLQRTPLMTEVELARAARIVALAADRHMASLDDLIYVRNQPMPDEQQRTMAAELRRLLAPVVDPDTGKPIALVTRRVGRAQWLRGTPEGLQVMRISEATEEVMKGDLLVAAPVPSAAGRMLAPHPAARMEGRVAAILHDGRWATVHDMVAINRGSRNGLDTGSVMHVVRPVKIRSHEIQQVSPPTSGIDEPLATLLVVDVLEHAALAIVMRALEPFSTGAVIASPDSPSQ